MRRIRSQTKHKSERGQPGSQRTISGVCAQQKNRSRPLPRSQWKLQESQYALSKIQRFRYWTLPVPIAQLWRHKASRLQIFWSRRFRPERFQLRRQQLQSQFRCHLQTRQFQLNQHLLLRRRLQKHPRPSTSTKATTTFTSRLKSWNSAASLLERTFLLRNTFNTSAARNVWLETPRLLLTILLWNRC